MHTFNGNSCIIHHNGDYSGYAEIVTGVNGDHTSEVLIQDLVEFVANYVRSNHIRQIENMSAQELLNISE